MRRLLVCVLAVTLAAVALLHSNGVAFANLYGGNCSYVTSGTNLTSYQNNGCVYSASMVGPGEYFPPYTQTSGDFLNITYELGTDSSGVAFPAHIATDIRKALAEWSNFGGNVRFSETTSNLGWFTNPLYIYPATDGYNFSSSCGGAWGQSWYPGNGLFHSVKLNELIFAACPNDNAWITTAAHEVGHTMGLDHNIHRYNGTSTCGGSPSYSMLMLGGCVIKVSAPQVTDYNAFNAIYPSFYKGCASQPSDYHCDGQDYLAQGCPDFPQTPATTSGPASVLVHYAGNVSCKSNWISASVSSGYTIYKVELKRSPTASDSNVDFDIYDMPDATTTHWYTNMTYSPSEYDKGCVWYQSTSTWAVTGPICTGYH